MTAKCDHEKRRRRQSGIWKRRRAQLAKGDVDVADNLRRARVRFYRRIAVHPRDEEQVKIIVSIFKAMNEAADYIDMKEGIELVNPFE